MKHIIDQDNRMIVDIEIDFRGADFGLVESFLIEIITVKGDIQRAQIDVGEALICQ